MTKQWTVIVNNTATTNAPRGAGQRAGRQVPMPGIVRLDMLVSAKTKAEAKTQAAKQAARLGMQRPVVVVFDQWC